MASSKTSPAPFSPPDLASIAKSVGLFTNIDEVDEEDSLTRELHDKLLRGAHNEISGQQLQPSLNLKDVAKFLSSISQAERSKLIFTVKTGLRGLGIKTPGPGRRRGRFAEKTYYNCVQEVLVQIEQNGIFKRRAEIKKEYGKEWLPVFQNLLHSEQWQPMTIGHLCEAKTPTAFAKYLTADLTRHSYAMIDKAYRNTMKAARK